MFISHLNNFISLLCLWGCVYVDAYAIGCGILRGTCNNRTMVPHKEIQWNNGTPQDKFYSLATLCHNREYTQVPHKCHMSGVCVCMRLFRHSNRVLITKGTIGSPVGKRPRLPNVYKTMLEYKQKRNNGRTQFAGVYKFVCMCVG